MDQIEKLFGVRPVYAGKHDQQGTHNALLNLGNEIYFEVIAIDPDNKKIPFPRWMGVDIIEQPTLTRWAVKSNEIIKKAAILKSKIPLLGEIKAGQREKTDGSMLNWQLTMPLPGPKVEIIPFFVDWQDSEHPTSKMPEGCNLVTLKAKHPNPENITPILESLGVTLEIEKSSDYALIAEIETPNGRIVLS